MCCASMKAHAEHAFLMSAASITRRNNKDSLHLPGDDRRHFVAWSARKKRTSHRTTDSMYRWFAERRDRDSRALLGHAYISGFDRRPLRPKTPASGRSWNSSRSRKTPKWQTRSTGSDPAAITLGSIVTRAAPDFADYLRDRRNRRKNTAPPRTNAECPGAKRSKDGLWVIAGKRQAIIREARTSLA